MKKCGAKPIDDTYVQLAHALNSSQARSKHTTAGHATQLTSPVLQLIEKFPSIEDWTAHKGTPILLTIISNVLLSQQTLPTPQDQSILEKLRQAGKSVWTLIDPFTKETVLDGLQKEAALTHYLLILTLSSPKEDLKEEVQSLLPLLKQFQSVQSRYTAMRVAQKLQDSDMAITYWNSFSKQVPLDLKSAILYLRILSKSKRSKESTALLQKIIALESPQSPNPKHFLLALFSCMSYIPNLGSVFKLLEQASLYPQVKLNIPVNQAILNSFVRATKVEAATKRHSPEFIYGIIRKLDMPSLLKQRDTPIDDRLHLIEMALELVQWRLDICDHPKQKLDGAVKELVLGDRKFYERWRDIVLKERKGESTD